MLVVYRVSLNPFGLQSREVQFSVAKAQVLIDTPVSQVGDERQTPNLGLMAHVATADALFLQTDYARTIAARAAGVSGREIRVGGPFNLLLNQTNKASTAPTGITVVPTAPNYRLVIDVDGWHPMITLYAQAPTTKAAVAIIDSARSLLHTMLNHHQQIYPLPPAFRAVARDLGPPRTGVVDPNGRFDAMLFVFGLVMFFGITLMFAIERRQKRLAGRLVDPDLGQIGDGSDDRDDWPHTTRLLPWTLAAFVAMIYLVPVDAMSLPIHLPLNSKPDRALLVAMAMVWIATLATVSGAARPRLKFTRAHFAVFAFVAICLVSVPLNGHTLAVNQEVSPVFKKLLLLLSFVSFFVIAASVLRPREVRHFIKLIIALGVIVAIASIVERTMKYNVFYSLWGKVTSVSLPPQLDKIDGIGRLSVDGPTQQPLELAALLAATIPFAIVSALQAITTKSRLLRLLAVAILLAGAFATGRKTGVVAPAVGLLVLIAYRPRMMLRGLLIVSLPMFITIHLMAPGQIGSTLVELLPGHATNALTTKDRVARYDAIRPDVMSHLLIGRGFQSYDPFKYRILDNEFLGLLIGVGAIGLVSYLVIFGVLLGMGHTMIRGPDPNRALAALAAQSAIVTIAVANALFDELSFTHVSYLFFFIAAMMVTLRLPVAETVAEPGPAVRRARVPDARRGLEERPELVPVH